MIYVIRNFNCNKRFVKSRIDGLTVEGGVQISSKVSIFYPHKGKHVETTDLAVHAHSADKLIDRWSGTDVGTQTRRQLRPDSIAI